MRVGELITNGNERRSETRMRVERGRCNEMVTRRRETRERERRCVIPPQGLFRASRFSGVASVSIRGRKGDSNRREASGA